MAFSIQSWSRISGSGNNTIKTLQDGTFVGAPCIYTYISATDLQAAIGGANYFLPKIFELNQGDFIWAIDANGVPEQYLVALVDIPNKTVLLTNASSSAGNVVGPGVSTINAIPVWNNVTGTSLANSLLTLVNAAGIGTITWTGAGALNIGASGHGLNITEVTTLRSGNALIFNNPANTFSTSIVEGASLASKTYTWPLAGPSVDGMVLSSTAAGQWSWVNIPGNVWINSAASPVTLAANSDYIANTAGLLTFNMPAVVAQGTVFRIAGKGAGGWLVQMNAGQTIFQSAAIHSTVAGSVASTDQYNAIEILCITANTTFSVISGNGTYTYA